MSKNKAITMLIVCAVIFSGLASYLIYHYMSPQRSTIFVFNDSYEAGKQITTDMLSPMQVDSTIVVAGMKTNVSNQYVTPETYADVIRSGDSLRFDVTKGMVLTTGMLAVSGGSSVEMNMKSNAVAVSIPLNSFSGITNDLKVGARVNIYSTIDKTTRLIQQNKRVLDVYKNNGELTGISVEETVSESMQLINAMASGSIYLGLVDASGYQSVENNIPTFSFTSVIDNSNAYNSQVNTTSPEKQQESEFFDEIAGTGVLEAEDTEETEAETEVSEIPEETETEEAETETEKETVFTPGNQ